MIYQEMLEKRAQLYNENNEALAEMGKPETTPERKTELQTKTKANIAEMKELTAKITLHEETLAAAGIIDSKGNPRMPAEPKDHSRDMPYEKGVRGIAEQLVDVYAYYHRGELSERLATVQAAATGGSSGVPSEGGFMVQPNQSDELIKTTIEQDDVLRLMYQINLGANEDRAERKMIRDRNRGNGFRWGGVIVYRRAEAETIRSFKADDFGMWECRLEDIAASTYLTERLAEDVSQLEGMIQTDVPKEFAFKLTDEAFRGTGVGQMLGILKSGSLVTVPIESGQTLATGKVLAENVLEMYARVPSYNRARGMWIYNQELEPAFPKMNLGAGVLGGALVFMPPGGISGTPYGNILGRPAVPFEWCSEVGTVGDFMFVDWSDYVLIKKGGIRSAMSICVKFLEDERCYKWIMRINGKPKYNEPITPYKGSNKRSSYVALAARS